MDIPPEIMLAQEEAVISRGPGVRKEVEGAFGLGGETEGTLVLTDRRLAYVHGGEKEVALQIGAWSKKRLYFADVESLNSMQMDSSSFEIPIFSILEVKGHKGEAIAPKLEVKWRDKGGATRKSEFVQQVTGRSRRRNLNDWARVIGNIKAKKQKITIPKAVPGEGSLQGRILAVLGDMQDKGLLTIEEEVEERYQVNLDPDEVEDACGKLVAAGLVRKNGERGEGPWFRKVSPLGEDDLSA